MSTRATIQIGQNIRLYRHCDGFPECCGADLKEHVRAFDGEYFDIEQLATDLVRSGNYMVADDEHGDEEYKYVISPESRKISVYHPENLDWEFLMTL